MANLKSVKRKQMFIRIGNEKKTNRLSASSLGALLTTEHVSLHGVKIVLPVLGQSPGIEEALIRWSDRIIRTKLAQISILLRWILFIAF